MPRLPLWLPSMATSTPETETFQARQNALRAVTFQEVMVLWPLLDQQSLDQTFPRFSAAMLAVVATRRRMSERLARDYLVRSRSAAGVAGVLPPAADRSAWEAAVFVAVLRSASVISVKKAMTRGTPLEAANRNALVNTLGVTDKAVRDAARGRIVASVEADPRARGYTRITSGGCDWCARRTDMATHPHCGCLPQPVYT